MERCRIRDHLQRQQLARNRIAVGCNSVQSAFLINRRGHAHLLLKFAAKVKFIRIPYSLCYMAKLTFGAGQYVFGLFNSQRGQIIDSAHAIFFFEHMHVVVWI
ncbi:hypothetical protein D3C73_1343210 [compost metagenome]